MNAARVLREVRAIGPMSRAEIARTTGLSKPTVTSVVDHLEREGFLLRVSGVQPLQPTGRRPQLYAFHADLRRVLGIDIGADKLVVLVANLDGQRLGIRRRDTRRLASRGPRALLAAVHETAIQLLAETSVTPEELLAVGVGTPGVVSAEGVVTLAPQLHGWEGLRLGAELTAMFGSGVHVEREVTLSLLAEQWVGAASDLQDALFIQLGVGVGAGLLLDGRVYRGADGGAGEIGMMPVDPASAPAPIPGFGPFEAAVGGAALARDGARLGRTARGRALRELAGGDPDAIRASTVFAAAAAGDRAAAVLVDHAVSALARGIAGLVCTLNPEVVILSGGMSRAGDQLLGPLHAQVSALVPFPPRFLTSTLGEEAVALGAIRRVTETLADNLVLPDLRVAQ